MSSVQRPLVSFDSESKHTAPKIEVNHKIISKGDAKTRLIWQGVKTSNYNFAAVQDANDLGIFDRKRNWIEVKIDNQKVLGNINSISKRFGIKPEQIHNYTSEQLGNLLKLIAADAVPGEHAMNLESESYVKDPLNPRKDKMIVDKDEEKVFKQLVQDISEKVIPSESLIYPNEQSKLQENVAKILYYRTSHSKNELAEFVFTKAFVRNNKVTEEQLGNKFYQSIKDELSKDVTDKEHQELFEQTINAFISTATASWIKDLDTAIAEKKVEAAKVFVEVLKKATQLARLAERKTRHDPTPPSAAIVNLFLYIELSKKVKGLKPPKFANLAIKLGLIDYVLTKKNSGLF